MELLTQYCTINSKILANKQISSNNNGLFKYQNFNLLSSKWPWLSSKFKIQRKKKVLAKDSISSHNCLVSLLYGQCLLKPFKLAKNKNYMLICLNK